MTVRDFLNVFSSGSVVFRLRLNDDTYPVLCRSDVDNRNYENIDALYLFNLLDCRIVDIIQTRFEVQVFIVE